MKKIAELEKKAWAIRKSILNMCIKAGTGHVTSSLSSVEIMVALYHGGILRHDPKNPNWQDRDRFILSKGHASPALYSILADCGYYDKKELDIYAKKDAIFGVHLQNDVPGVEITSGSLGQGLGVAAGLAQGAKMNGELHLVYCLLGDGECYEGSVWEAVMYAGHNRLNNLIAIVDRNYLCVTDFTESLIALEPMEDKWRAFGWDTIRIDGHSIEELKDTLYPLRSRKSSKPLVVIADTVKGEGVDLLCYKPAYHGRAPRGEDVDKSLDDFRRRYCHYEN